MVHFLKRHKLLCGWFLISGTVLLLFFPLRTFAPQAVAHYFTNPVLIALGKFSDLFPFSLAETSIFLLVVGLICALVYAVICFVKGDKKQVLICALICAFSLFFTVYSGFSYLWGIGYYTPTLRQSSDIARYEHTPQQLFELTVTYAKACNDTYTKVDKQTALAITDDIFIPLKNDFPALHIQGGIKVKEVFFSKVMSYLDFTGFYFPFFGECNVNTHAPSHGLPATVVHELAHRAGIHAEDEANLIAILACAQSDNPQAIYSGNLLAYSYLANALYRVDKDLWEQAVQHIGEWVKADFIAESDYWEAFDTPAAQISNSTYNSFLQSYHQQDGIKTYGKVVDLLLDITYPS